MAVAAAEEQPGAAGSLTHTYTNTSPGSGNSVALEINPASLGRAPLGTDFVFRIATTTANETFYIPCVNKGTFNATIDWGDGGPTSTVTAYNDANLTHVYATANNYVIRITGQFGNVYFSGHTVQADKVKQVYQLGNMGWHSDQNYSWRACTTMTHFDAGITDLDATNLNGMLRDCRKLKKVVMPPATGAYTANSMMYFADLVVAPDFSAMTGTMTGDCYRVFFYFVAQQPILDMNDIDVSGVTRMSGFFGVCNAKTVDVTGWVNTANTQLDDFFYYTNINTFDWPVGVTCENVTNMSSFGIGADAFTSLTGLENWILNPALNTDCSNFLPLIGDFVIDLDAIYIAWEAQGPPSNMVFNFGGAKYTSAGAAAKASLESTYGWTITDGGLRV